jgi:hypothetical protein
MNLVPGRIYIYGDRRYRYLGRDRYPDGYGEFARWCNGCERFHHIYFLDKTLVVLEKPKTEAEIEEENYGG